MSRPPSSSSVWTHSPSPGGAYADGGAIRRVWPLLLGLILCLLTRPAAVSAQYDEAEAPELETYRIGVLAFRDREHARERWQPTGDYLGNTMAGARFQVIPMNYPQLERAVADGGIDFVLTNTGHYVQLEARHGITRVATLEALEQGRPVRRFGGLVFTRAERTDIQYLRDLHGTRLHAVNPGSLGGWLAGYETLLDAGVDPHEDLKELTFTGMPHDRVVEAVLAGEADAGMVRTGVLEGLVREGRLDSAALRVLEPREDTGFPVAHTTRLFPEWPFSRLAHTDAAIAQQVTIALLEMDDAHPATTAGTYRSWSAPLSYAPVHELLERLGEPPYDRLKVVDLWGYWRANPQVGFAILLLIMGLMAMAIFKYRRMNQDMATEVAQRRTVEAQLRRHEEELAHRATHDPLTELPNRVLLTDRLQHVIVDAADSEHRVALLFVDLDRFKDVNDSLGHRVGDELLKILGERLRERVTADTIARLGGDEFIILLDNIDSRLQIEARARKILALIAEPFAVGGWRALEVGASIGISLYPDNSSNAQDLLTQADAAMYEAKSAGRNTFSFYTEAMTRAASQRLETENRLRHAVERGELEVFYQPQIDMEGHITGVEALIRWREPECQLIPPGIFIPIAEETGLIARIGQFVLREACRQSASWDAAGLPPLDISVNLSSQQVSDPALIHQVRQTLKASGLPPHRLTLEMTETSLIEQAETTFETLRELKALGVRMAIDDFGTGYSSLAYLKRFPIDILKIDRAFVRDLPEDRSDAELAVTIINLAHNLRLSALAEGVETEAQRDFLETNHCDAWQGFLCSAPVPPDHIPALIEAQNKRR
ncbi:MAG: EAL domain-containing protein, partial [Thioalkalivibrio sp.]|nr:EAL domain-containing protein [Thioalkalivibrio sp.]